jgi:hypothetical protein
MEHISEGLDKFSQYSYNKHGETILDFTYKAYDEAYKKIEKKLRKKYLKSLNMKMSLLMRGYLLKKVSLYITQ